MYHKITIAGYLGRDPEMRYMQDGTAVTSFSVAVNDGFGENKKTLWFRVSIWGRRAEVANQYLQKGRPVLIEGRLQGDAGSGGPRLWTRNDGTVAASFEITATDFAFLGSGGEGGGHIDDDHMSSSGGSSAPASSAGGSAPAANRGSSSRSRAAVEEDDIPF